MEYIHKQLEFKLRNDIDIFNNEIRTCSVEIITSKSRNFVVTGVYRPPKGDVKVFKNYYEDFLKKKVQAVKLFIPFWERAFLRKRDRQELIFTLKAEMDDFRHKSTRFIVVFIDFVDAFASVKHEFIFETLSHFGRKNEKSMHV